LLKPFRELSHSLLIRRVVAQENVKLESLRHASIIKETGSISKKIEITWRSGYMAAAPFPGISVWCGRFGRMRESSSGVAHSPG